MKHTDNFDSGHQNSPSGDGGILSLIVAASSNNAIGKGNQLLWHLPADLKFFKNTTWAMPVIMGRKTFEAVNSKPLPGRLNIIISRQEGLSSPYNNAVFVTSVEQAIDEATATNAKEIFIAGGAQIYEQTFERAQRIYLTRVHANFEADAFFPELDPAEWELRQSQSFPADEKHAYSFDIQVWERKQKAL
jgi:dihydrofolate reductase